MEKHQVRELDCFFCSELLPLYIEKKLDRRRVVELETHIKNCSTCEGHLGGLEKARFVLSELSTLSPSSELLNFVKREHHWFEEVFERFGWGRWPSSLKWTVEIGVTAVGIAVAVHFLPWNQIYQYLQQSRPFQKQQVASPASQTENVVNVAQTEPTEVLPPTTVYGPPRPSMDTIRDEKMESTTPYIPAEMGTDVMASNDRDSQSVGNQNTTPVVGEGFVWRGTMKAPLVDDEVANQIADLIVGLGGVKAGKVNLGWRRDAIRYYHFIIASDKYQELLAGLKNVNANGNLIKEKHPRIIPEGKMRIILNLEGTTPSEESPPAEESVD